MDDFNVRVHHRGRFCSNKNKTEYINGEVTTVDWCELDRWSVIETYDVVEKFGYITENIGVLWYKDTELGSEGLKLLRVPGDFCYDIGYLDVGSGSKVVEKKCVDVDSGSSNIRQAQNIEVEAQGGGVDMEAQIQGFVDVHLNVEEML
ncbi:hypothetical protein Ahy_A01g004521 isoform B [Arachis hypogaea]|uniref:PB1-like domain-containing protein n=1 Tax=Arachis hypogaea TaxID=3818 RepID=A0A445EWA3_ARAHY|nr:hypothetical protein Ahy_A01g004521 isoform B [Arachis hypogaea]